MANATLEDLKKYLVVLSYLMMRQKRDQRKLKSLVVVFPGYKKQR